MTKDEKLAIIAAHLDGKTIQLRQKGTNLPWHKIDNPAWMFDKFDYRIKPEPDIRPYANAAEFAQAMRVHGPAMRDLDNETVFEIPRSFTDKGIFFYAVPEPDSYEYALENHCWQDGAPCGILQESPISYEIPERVIEDLVDED